VLLNWSAQVVSLGSPPILSRWGLYSQGLQTSFSAPARYYRRFPSVYTQTSLVPPEFGDIFVSAGLNFQIEAPG